MSESAIYTGRVRHRRHTPVTHAFRYPICMLYLDLDELPDLLAQTPFWSARRPAPGWFRRRDFHGDPQRPLAECIRDLVETHTGLRPGPVRLLTNLRYFGFLTNPISCYYCFDEQGRTLQAVVAEVTNTPWEQRQCYVLPCDPGSSSQDIGFRKTLHVSPFNPMTMSYRWRGRTPAETLSIHLENHMNNACVFDATLSLNREPITAGALNRLLFIRYPLISLRILARIYVQALKLLLKRAPFYANPHATTEESR